jgi:5-formyltetrahydrofolate cyclo-ligase
MTAPLISTPQTMDWHDIVLWRKVQRDRCVAWRTAIAEVQRVAWGKQITVSLLALLKSPEKRVIGFCWPYRAEFDARFAIRRWCEEGAIAALPEVVGKALPLRFRQWWPGAPMTRGVYGIPVPDGTPELQPDLLVVPMNAFDDRGYRLGYGGGYFDRTIAALRPRVVTIGVSHEHCRVPTIYPQSHDIALDFVVTEAGVYAAGSGSRELLDAEIALAHLQQLVVGWGAPDGNQ